MLAIFIDGHALAKSVHKKTKQIIEKKLAQGITPKLAIILIGNDKPSEMYISIKQKKAKELGIETEVHRYAADISYTAISKELQNIQKSDLLLSGLIIQLPIPDVCYPRLINEIDPKLDVDCLTDVNLGKIVMHTNTLVPPTPGAVMTILDSININLKGKRICIVGTGVLVGKPLAIMCMNRQATVTTVNEYTADLTKHTSQADIVISGVGKKHLITEEMIRPETIVIDAGVNFTNGSMFGDVHVDTVQNRASYITPTPGGVGPLTVAMLLHNVALSA